MNPISPLALASHKLSKKPRMLVVDDEPDNLDLLSRTFRRNFKVLRAESGIEALELLTQEGEVAIIISDQRMPEMKGTEFLSKTVADFPDTVRMILTGFTDVEDLVDAINTGQVYRYITKPWDPDDLLSLVSQASNSYEVTKEQADALHRAETLSKLVVTVGQLALQNFAQNNALTFLAEEVGQILGADDCLCFLPELDSVGGYGTATVGAARENKLIQAAISTHRTQSAMQIQAEPAQANETLYHGCTECHLVLPLVDQDNVLAVLSLQWNTPYTTLAVVTRLPSLSRNSLVQNGNS